MLNDLLGGAFSRPVRPVFGGYSQHDPQACAHCWHLCEGARNAAADNNLRLLKALQANNKGLAEGWAKFSANQVTGVIYDDVQ